MMDRKRQPNHGDRMMLVAAGLVLFTMVFQWLTQEIVLKFLGFSIHYPRDEHPALFWSVQALEVALCGLFVYWWF
jgi:hypothetical protein